MRIYKKRKIYLTALTYFFFNITLIFTNAISRRLSNLKCQKSLGIKCRNKLDYDNNNKLLYTIKYDVFKNITIILGKKYIFKLKLNVVDNF